MSRPILMAAVLALAAANLPTPEPEKRGSQPMDDPIQPPYNPEPEPDPEGERIKGELRERRRQNFLKQRKA